MHTTTSHLSKKTTPSETVKNNGVFNIERAKIEDVDALMELYFSVYGNRYPIIYGSDPEAASKLILSKKDYWYIIRDPNNHKPVASLIIHIDPGVQIGEVIALAVHPSFQKKGLGNKILEFGCDELFSSPNCPSSIYATTRTNSIGPQRLFLKNGFLPMGIFPNSHYINDFETLTFFVRYRADVLARRKQIEFVPTYLKDFYSILEKSLPIKGPFVFLPKTVRSNKITKSKNEFESISAPEFVAKRFAETFQNPYDRYYPFHRPNFLMVSKTSPLEIYMHLNPKDRYCAILAASAPLFTIEQQLAGLFAELRWKDISYLECLIRCDALASLETMIDLHFIPSAIYPAMLPNENGEMMDFVLLSRSFEPLNFEGIFLDEAFKPYLDQYIELWEKQAIEGLEVVRARR